MLLPVSPLSAVESWLLVNEGTNEYWHWARVNVGKQRPVAGGWWLASVVSRLMSHCHRLNVPPLQLEIRRSAAVASVRCPSRLSCVPFPCPRCLTVLCHSTGRGTRNVERSRHEGKFDQN